MKRKLFIIFFICALTVPVKGVQPPEDSFRRGSTEYISGNLEEALIYIYKAYKQDPQNKKTKKLLSEIYVELSAKYLTEGNYVDASKYLAEAEKLNYDKAKTGNIRKALDKIRKSGKPAPKKTKKTAAKKKKRPAKHSRRSAPKSSPKSDRKVVRERVVEYQPFVIEKKLPVNAAVFAGILAGVLIIFFLIIFYFKRAMKTSEMKTKEFLEEKEREGRVLKEQFSSLRDLTGRLKEDLETEKRKKLEITKNIVDEKKRIVDEKTYEKISNKINEVKKAVKKKSAVPAPIPVKSFLAEYTDIPITSKQLGDLLEAAPQGNRSQIFWGLGNKTDIKAVEILENFMAQTSGEEYREILKSLKKIAVRPGMAEPIKIKIENIFSAQRRKGIII